MAPKKILWTNPDAPDPCETCMLNLYSEPELQTLIDIRDGLLAGAAKTTEFNSQLNSLPYPRSRWIFECVRNIKTGTCPTKQFVEIDVVE